MYFEIVANKRADHWPSVLQNGKMKILLKKKRKKEEGKGSDRACTKGVNLWTWYGERSAL
jgi:hypothetical protein